MVFVKTLSDNIYYYLVSLKKIKLVGVIFLFPECQL